VGYGSIQGRARTNPTAPRAKAVCDRCGFWYNHYDLQWQYDYRGRSIQNIRILVCETCLDKPNPQLMPRIIPQDPVPIDNARVEPFMQDESNFRVVSANPFCPWINNYGEEDKWKNNANKVMHWQGLFAGIPTVINEQTGIPVEGNAIRITQDDNNRVTQQTGEAPGGLNQLPGTDWAVPEYTTLFDPKFNKWYDNNGWQEDFFAKGNIVAKFIGLMAPPKPYTGRDIGLPLGNTTVPFTGPLSPPYNALQNTYDVKWVSNEGIWKGWQNNAGDFMIWQSAFYIDRFVPQWNNTQEFGVRTGSYWTNEDGSYIKWSTTTL
jgi:hypothetical protein